MDKFIRIDFKGNWKGTEHKSCFAGTIFTESDEDVIWEDGISCYKIYENDKAFSIEQLYKYWTEIASCRDLDDYTDKQITIFEGEKLDTDGADGEDLAICTRTIKEINAYEFMKVVFEAKNKLEAFEEEWEDEEQITPEEYNSILESLVGEM